MKEYRFSKIAKIQMRKQLANTILLTILILFISIGFYIKKSLFYGRLLLIFGIIGCLLTVIITRKVRRLNDIFYLKVFKDRIELNSNINYKGQIIMLNEIIGIKEDKKGAIILVSNKKYRILKSFLEDIEWTEVRRHLSKFIKR
ncbi:MAG: hypothetical protein E6929_15865 [Clostridium sp.]|nr:hypothetical protein [Clostridium sp.]